MFCPQLVAGFVVVVGLIVVTFLPRTAYEKHLPIGSQSENTVFRFLWRSVNGKHLIRFQTENTLSKFFRRSVSSVSAGRKHLMRFRSETSVFQIPPAKSVHHLQSCSNFI